ncbi:uncharacterized protein A1O5_11786 [Cladophialophora psammophila CBS 110553]|uniref:Uncharacterized protein n=1 Tax=Cladophialophora psammophila CBS 110553 TaxID=1182543 RepID=W9W910_9EURO|nr:uncharacterized protein A1O5_11786 [Cladophialophora psammophila CBS 110553]EXJ61470.1 hypothetical protein A1O5_11786 [Cladophialophora psammophila CBS 110553]
MAYRAPPHGRELNARGDQRRLAIQDRVGILSRTLSSSSSIRWILPARIRSPSDNDVVFVGPTFVQLHEFKDSGQLEVVTAKLDFGTTITDAKIISAELKSVPIVDAILKQERDQEQFSIRGQPVSDTLPPQILVLITKDNELIYVYARKDAGGEVRLVFAKRPFLGGVDLPSRQCRDIAVDPESRALAVASPSGYLGVFKLHHVDEIKSEIDAWDPIDPASFRPSEEQRFIQVAGKILMMTFLRSPEDDPTKVILLLLVYSGEADQGTHQYLYRWDTRQPLQTIQAMTCSGRKLREDQLPLMLIPSTRPFSYIVVMAAGISYYENIQSSQMKRVYCRCMDNMNTSLEWVQWVRPRRHNQYLERCDDIVILREDGLLKNFLIDKASSTKFSTNNTIGHLGFSVDTAFCMLSGPPRTGGDIIIVGGSLTDGGVFHVSARGSPERIQRIETLAPLNDIALGPPIAVDSQDSAVWQGTPGRLYACSGRCDRHGQVSEIRYGLEAQIGWEMSFPEAALVERLFSLEIPGTNELLLLASHTTNSSMVVFELENQEISLTDAESHPGFDFGHPTLAATVIDQDTVIQVTTRGVHAILIEADGEVGELNHLGSRIAHAAFFEGDRAIATTSRVTSGYELCLIDIETSEDGALRFMPGQPLRLKHIPNAICCVQVQNTQLVLIGTSTGEVLGYTDTLKLAFEFRVQDLNTKVENAAVASVVALKQNTAGPTLLLCGLRSGTVMCLELRVDCQDGLKTVLRCDDVYHIGATPVQIVQEKSQSGSLENPSALVLCEYTLHRVTLHPNSALVDYTMSPLWVTDRTKPSAQPLINAVHRIPKLESGHEHPGGFLICAVAEDLLFCSVISQEHGIARHLNLNGVPKRMLYSRFLQRFVVAFSREGDPTEVPVRMHTSVPLDGEKDISDQPSNKIQRVGLQLITPNLRYPTSRDSEGTTFATIVTGDDSDVVHDLIDWAPTDGNNHYEWLVLAIEQLNPIPGLRGPGRVVCVNAKSLGKGKPDASPKLAFSSREPITAICAYKMSSLLIAAGREIVLHHLDWATRRWKTLARHALPSYANAISCQGSLICVATQQHSFFVLVEKDNKLHHRECDTKMRYAKDIVVLDGSTAVFASADVGVTNIIGFLGLNKETTETAPAFHAAVPGHIHRFRLDTSQGLRKTDRTRFYGCTIDGTLFHFALLKHSEWKLLHFIEEMSYMIRKPIKAVPIEKKDADNTRYLWMPPAFRPKDMHVQGDRLLMMIEQGPYNLRSVLRGSDRMDSFKALVEEILGEAEEPVEAVIAWIRKLMRYPPRS